MKVELNDIIKYIKKNNVSKEEMMYLLYLYNNKEENFGSAKITMADVLEGIKVINDSLSKSTQTSIVLDRINRELEIFKKITETNYHSQEFIDNMFYEIGQLMYEEDLHISKSELILIKKLQKEKDNDKDYRK